MYQKYGVKFNRVSFAIILSICGLIPFFFLPSGVSGFGAVKGVLFYVGIFFAFSLWLLSQFINGTLHFPNHRALIVLGVLTVLSFVSALTASNVKLALWGRGFVVDSFATTLTLALFAFLVSVYASDQRRQVKLFLTAFTGSVLTIILQILLYLTRGTAFVAEHFSHVATNGTLVGSWVDFAYFATATFVLSLLIFEVLIPKGFFRKLSFISMVLSLITLLFLNFKAAWIIAVVAALFTFVYKFSVERAIFSRDASTDEGETIRADHRFPFASFSALLIGLFFFLSSGSIGASIARYAGINFTDFRPSFDTTLEIAQGALSKDPLFGAGAGRFADIWNLYRPVDINATVFWNTPFEEGFSLLSTITTTQGPLVALSILVLFVLVFISGINLFKLKFPDRFSRFIAVTTFIMFVAFVALYVFSFPSIVLIILGFMYIGLLLGVSAMLGRAKMVSIEYLKDPRTSFFIIFFLVVATMASLGATYLSASRFASVVYFNRALTATNIEQAVGRVDRALMLSQNDIYFRTRTALFANQFAQLARLQDADKTLLQQNFTQAEQSATRAVAWDRGSAANWSGLSQVYQLLAANSEEAYTNAMQAAQEAQVRNPHSPVLMLNIGQIAALQKNNEGAYAAIDRSLALKSDYLDAYALRAAIKNDAGDTAGARAEIKKYTELAPFDPEGFMLLSSMYIRSGDFQAAKTAYDQARTLSPQNVNLQLQYVTALAQAGRRNDAIAELRAFQDRFPNAVGVDEEIARLQNQTPPATSTTETEE